MFKSGREVISGNLDLDRGRKIGGLARKVLRGLWRFSVFTFQSLSTSDQVVVTKIVRSKISYALRIPRCVLFRAAYETLSRPLSNCHKIERHFRFRALRSTEERRRLEVVVRRSSQFPWNGKINAIAPLDARIPESGMQLKNEYRSDSLPGNYLRIRRNLSSVNSDSFLRSSDAPLNRENSQVCTNTGRAACSFLSAFRLFSPYVLFYFTRCAFYSERTCSARFPTFIASRLGIPSFRAKLFPRYSGLVGQLFRFDACVSLLSRASSFPVLLVVKEREREQYFPQIGFRIIHEANRLQLRVNSTSRYYPSSGIFAHGCESKISSEYT